MAHHRSRKRGRSKGEAREGGRLVRARTTSEVGEVAASLETLAQALRAGGVTIRRGPELAVLRVGEQVQLSLAAGEEGGESVLNLELRWETPQPEEPLEIVPALAVSPAPNPPTADRAQPKPPSRTPGRTPPAETAERIK